jgi:fumarylpyruvate hydrolase
MQLPVVTVPTLEIGGATQRFPVRRIYCVGQNYAEHAREMGSDSSRNPPFFFTKPADAVVATKTRLQFPTMTADLHHEVELVVALGQGGAEIAVGDALATVFGWGVGIDLTRRDLQAQAKAAGRPWDLAKGFDSSAPVGPLVRGAPPQTAKIALLRNGETRQSGDVADMIWVIPEIIATLSRYVRLAPGDLIFTGTPAGVGAIRAGDTLIGTLDGAPSIEVSFDH